MKWDGSDSVLMFVEHKKQEFKFDTEKRNEKDKKVEWHKIHLDFDE